MDPQTPHSLAVADAAFVTSRLLIGGDLHTRDTELAGRQLGELVAVGVTHVVDARVEWSDESWVALSAPGIAYLHHGMDDAGQQVPGAWFDIGVSWALAAIDQGGTVLTHCHMGINRGPSLGFAVLLAQGWDAVDALDAIRRARPIAWVAYAEDALRWHHARTSGGKRALGHDRRRLKQWRRHNELDLSAVIRLKRTQGW